MSNAPHGSVAAYFVHRRSRETPCDECREAWNAYQRQARSKERARRLARQSQQIRDTAFQALAQKHPEEYAALKEKAAKRIRREK